MIATVSDYEMSTLINSDDLKHFPVGMAANLALGELLRDKGVRIAIRGFGLRPPVPDAPCIVWRDDARACCVVEQE